MALQEAAHTEGAWLSLVQGEEDRQAVAGLIALADHLQWADKHFRRELAAWARPRQSQRRDGLPGFALNLGDALAQAGLRAGRTFDLGNGQAARDRQLAAGAPVLAVLGTDVDTAYDWLMAGQALALVLLSARSQGVWASFLNQPIEIPEVRLMLHNVDLLFPSSLCQDGPRRTAEVDEFRSLFLLVCHIRGRTWQYQGTEDRNIDKLLSLLFSFSFLFSLLSARRSSYVHTESIVERPHSTLTNGRLFITHPSQADTPVTREQGDRAKAVSLHIQTRIMFHALNITFCTATVPLGNGWSSG